MADEPLFKPEVTDTGSQVTPTQQDSGYTDVSGAIENIGKAFSFLLSNFDKRETLEETVDAATSNVSPSIPSTVSQAPAESSSMGMSYTGMMDDVPTTAPVGKWITPEIAAFLNTISEAEGTNSSKGYNMIVGLGKAGAPAYFYDYAQHPNVIGLRTSHGPSTAAGRYQIVNKTWRGLVKNNPELKDFSPDSQDKAAWILAQYDYKKKWGRDLGTDLKNNVTEYLPSLKSTWQGFYYKNPITLFQKYRGGSNATKQ
jgi:muramidase (phage lysozyme)